MPKAALPPLEKVDPNEAWKPWEPDNNQPWDLKWAGHLYRRAAFGAALPELHDAVKRGLPATLERLFQGQAPTNDNFADTRRTSGLNGGRNAFDLRGWWVYWMLKGAHPLREKLTLFWHNHFATSIVKVQKPRAMFEQNELMYRHAAGKFAPFLLAMSKDPAMLVWLDSNSNVKGKPNENFAREVMELFSLGVGNYTEKDVREAARAFTGWHTDGERFTFKQNLHDGDSKTVLGQSGNWNGDDVLRILLEQSAASRFLVRKFYRFYVSEEAPPDHFIQPLAEAFKKSDYDTAALLKTILQSRHFYSAYAYRQRIKSPVEYCLCAGHQVGQNLLTPRALVGRLEAMGQQLFAPPNVKGWEYGKSWLNTSTVLARHNFAQAITSGKTEINAEDPEARIAIAIDAAALVRKAQLTEPKPTVAFLLDTLVDGEVSPSAREKLIEYLADGKPEGDARDTRVREVVHAIMTMPEYQLN
ncbi:MAG: DUF1800 domain-containing protein [Gemmataceae bacterium]|nr:DUF1800 domain-containing protein [Gemmataceae bacterium]